MQRGPALNLICGSEILAIGKTTVVMVDPRERIRALRRQKRKIEWIMIGLTIFIFGGISVFLLIPSQALRRAEALISFLENGGKVSRNPAVTCADPRNRNTAYCLDKRGRTEGDSKAFPRIQDSKVNQFSLGGR